MKLSYRPTSPENEVINNHEQQTRLLIATFIVATLIAYLQLDANKIGGTVWLYLGTLVLPLTTAAWLAFLFIMAYGLSIETSVLEARQRQHLHKAGQILYSMSVVCYAVTLPAFLCAIGLSKVMAYFTDTSTLYWLGHFVIITLPLAGTFFTINGCVRADLAYRKKVYQRLLLVGILYNIFESD